MPRKMPSPTKAPNSIGRSQSPSQTESGKPPAKAARKQLAGKAPLGSLPAEKEQSSASSKTDYSIGDVVFWGTPTTAGEYTFIGHPKGDKDGKVLVLAHSAEIGFEVDADECRPTGSSNPQRGREYRQRYFSEPKLSPSIGTGSDPTPMP